MSSWKVELAVYDISMGMASQMSMAILGQQIEAIYHTGIIVYGKEFFFGGGIQQCAHEQFVSQHGGIRPIQIMELGHTDIPEEVFQDFLRELSPRFTMATYDLIKNNCNNFSDACADFLLGKGIPEHIVGLPERVFSTPMGQMLKPMIEGMQNSINNPEQRIDALQTMGATLFGAFAVPQVQDSLHTATSPEVSNKDLSRKYCNITADLQIPGSSCIPGSLSRKRLDSGRGHALNADKLIDDALNEVFNDSALPSANKGLQSVSESNADITGIELKLDESVKDIATSTEPQKQSKDEGIKGGADLAEAPSSGFFLEESGANGGNKNDTSASAQANQLMGSFLESLRRGQLGEDAISSAQGLIGLLSNQEKTAEVLEAMKRNLPVPPNDSV